MTSNYQLAYDAIEAFIAEHHSDDSGAWQELIPDADLGYTSEGWEAAATAIVNLFNDSLPDGGKIRVPVQAKRNALSKPLIEFQRYLAAKADEAGARSTIRPMEMRA
ncbi:MAG: hypothetical protein P0Y59_13705 [Candidatus Sphingomonas phytovorans]|nr:hypothetical protein [Sphingomonas sp.]WEJ98013.1 MAG: hypothetical protein P0Y59_13705 [Sphingomonas sp.]